jgi:hypothetical protein
MDKPTAFAVGLFVIIGKYSIFNAQCSTLKWVTDEDAAIENGLEN